MTRRRGFAIWGAVIATIVLPVMLAAFSPQLAWRDPVYIVAGFAGIGAMAALFAQPMLAGGYLPGLTLSRMRMIHRFTGVILLICVILHVLALWITSPPDVIDALLFASPTPFSAWGVIAMWGIFATACLALLRKRITPRLWRQAHSALALVIVVTSIAHAMLIDGTMEPASKAAICALTLIASFKAVIDRRAFAARNPR